jgi:hypothetical protein
MTTPAPAVPGETVVLDFDVEEQRRIETAAAH